MVVFNTGLNRFGRKYLIKNPGEDEQELASTWATESNKCLADLASQLLFFDKVSIKVYGENITLPILIHELGINQLEELLEEEAIEFVLWTPVLTTLQGEDLIEKSLPLQSGELNSPAHSIAEESVKQGLSRGIAVGTRQKRRQLMRKLAKVYKIPRSGFVHSAADFAMSAYTTGKLKHIGLDNTKDIKLLNFEERWQLLTAAEDVLETGILAEYRYSSFGNYSYYKIAKQTCDTIRSASTVLAGMNEILKTEHLPDVQALIAENKLSLKDIVNLRRKNSSQKFRKWLVDANTDDYITQKYVEDIANAKGPFETMKGKFIKTIGMYGISTGVGSLVGGVPGSVAGAAVGVVLQPLADIGLDLLDTYFLESLLKGWQPRLFVNEYKKMIDKNLGTAP